MGPLIVLVAGALIGSSDRYVAVSDLGPAFVGKSTVESDVCHRAVLSRHM